MMASPVLPSTGPSSTQLPTPRKNHHDTKTQKGHLTNSEKGITPEIIPDEEKDDRRLSPEEELAADTTPPLLSVVAMGNNDLKFPEVLKGPYVEDPFFKTILGDPKHYISKTQVSHAEFGSAM
jgi:hypothetical protein